jgi:hypothetical protein
MTELQSPAGTHFDPQEGFFLVQIDMERYGFKPQAVEYNGQTFEPKDELHITILSQGAAEAAVRYIKSSPEAEDTLRRLIERTDWSYRKLGRYFHVRREPGVESIIELVEVPALPGFFEQLSFLTGQELALPPAHVTLYVVGDKKGIGIPDQEAFQRLVVGPVERL